ncbi:hypothetical protein AYR62_13065 [Secundilactobacillus paracollinoides]|uniref:Flavin reductase like domain-containing protein n=1 Tax=Secundilactobacillus paracollinoides TaxID=240427 RepID=A0A1B2IWP7_9LACO|nr:flavin reductase family protein [Secundilactobacillus paracollinoides]ANZ60579.1 hypothetical protein AYR61_03940 [Secundilactobacillus paracollinoides]ANZ64911.1 hypothetical protein AYR62_13065 [Secundilactobacillus paracollinoides]ANZ66428.1 hypothetical protein AYR63_04290 [Secundilactobacillus paracollinoides]KRL80987.1 hypothetical protein FC17_GL002802 [Secundilactobacillus paracollinoides DSM 15502 = JCM 11969]
MYHFRSDDLTPVERYKLLSGSVIPRPIAWVMTKDIETLNLAPISFFQVASGLMPWLTLSVGYRNGKRKDTADNILTHEEAVVHLVDEDLVKQMNATAASLPHDQSELDLINLPLVPSQTVEVPGLKAAKIRFETKLYDYKLLKDPTGQPMSDFFFLEVTDMYFDESVLDPDKKYVDYHAFNPVARLAGPNYAMLGNEFELRRPL